MALSDIINGLYGSGARHYANAFMSAANIDARADIEDQIHDQLDDGSLFNSVGLNPGTSGAGLFSTIGRFLNPLRPFYFNKSDKQEVAMGLRELRTRTDALGRDLSANEAGIIIEQYSSKAAKAALRQLALDANFVDAGAGYGYGGAGYGYGGALAPHQVVPQNYNWARALKPGEMVREIVRGGFIIASAGLAAPVVAASTGVAAGAGAFLSTAAIGYGTYKALNAGFGTLMSGLKTGLGRYGGLHDQASTLVGATAGAGAMALMGLPFGGALGLGAFAGLLAAAHGGEYIANKFYRNTPEGHNSTAGRLFDWIGTAADWALTGYFGMRALDNFNFNPGPNPGPTPTSGDLVVDHGEWFDPETQVKFNYGPRDANWFGISSVDLVSGNNHALEVQLNSHLDTNTDYVRLNVDSNGDGHFGKGDSSFFAQTDGSGKAVFDTAKIHAAGLGNQYDLSSTYFQVGAVDMHGTPAPLPYAGTPTNFDFTYLSSVDSNSLFGAPATPVAAVVPVAAVDPTVPVVPTQVAYTAPLPVPEHAFLTFNVDNVRYDLPAWNSLTGSEPYELFSRVGHSFNAEFSDHVLHPLGDANGDGILDRFVTYNAWADGTVGGNTPMNGTLVHDAMSNYGDHLSIDTTGPFGQSFVRPGDYTFNFTGFVDVDGDGIFDPNYTITQQWDLEHNLLLPTPQPDPGVIIQPPSPYTRLPIMPGLPSAPMV